LKNGSKDCKHHPNGNTEVLGQIVEGDTKQKLN